LAGLGFPALEIFAQRGGEPFLALLVLPAHWSPLAG
jgi:hypothetical protein